MKRILVEFVVKEELIAAETVVTNWLRYISQVIDNKEGRRVSKGILKIKVLYPLNTFTVLRVK